MSKSTSSTDMSKSNFSDLRASQLLGKQRLVRDPLEVATSDKLESYPLEVATSGELESYPLEVATSGDCSVLEKDILRMGYGYRYRFGLRDTEGVDTEAPLTHSLESPLTGIQTDVCRRTDVYQYAMAVAVGLLLLATFPAFSLLSSGSLAQGTHAL